MKVLHVIPSIASVRGGPSQAVIQMVKALHSLNIQVEIATTNDNGDTILDVPLGERIDYQDVPVWFFSRFSPRIHALREFAFSSQLTNWLWNNISQYNLLHVHAIFSYPATIAMLIARIKNVPYICRPLGQLCSWSLQQSYWKKQAYLNLVERGNLNCAKLIHFTSEQEEKEASLLHLKSSHFVLPHGLSIPLEIPQAKQKLRQKLNLPEDEPIVLFLSRLHPKKGLDYLIPALGKLTDQQFTFILAGNSTPEYGAEIDSLLHQHHLISRTLKVGFVEGEEKNLLLQGADIFTLTSHSENFGIVVLEALAAKTPAIVTPGVALSSMLKKEQIGYVPNLDIDEISQYIKYCLENLSEVAEKGDLSEAEALRERAYKLVLNNYSWNFVASQLMNVYQTIIEVAH